MQNATIRFLGMLRAGKQTNYIDWLAKNMGKMRNHIADAHCTDRPERAQYATSVPTDALASFNKTAENIDVHVATTTTAKKITHICMN